MDYTCLVLACKLHPSWGVLALGAEGWVWMPLSPVPTHCLSRAVGEGKGLYLDAIKLLGDTAICIWLRSIFWNAIRVICHAIGKEGGIEFS